VEVGRAALLAAVGQAKAWRFFVPLRNDEHHLNDPGDQILRCLQSVAAERASRHSDATLTACVAEVKRFQHARFEATYADLLASPRYAAAAQFFLDDLYGPSDFSQRDKQFERVVPALVRVFPKDIVTTVSRLALLHELSESLDTAMGRLIRPGVLTAENYAQAWRAVGRVTDRERQISLTLEVGSALDRFTKNPLLRGSLRMMRGPAQAAGLGSLQDFLESGFDAFRGMRGAEHFLGTIAERERQLSSNLFWGDKFTMP
jgi:hypothetical protein